MTAKFPLFCCPLCKGKLECNQSNYYCSPCHREFPIVLGIPDFRIFPDSYIDFQDDYDKAKILKDKAAELNLDFRGLVHFYWSITPEVSQDRADLFTRRMFLLAEKGKQNLKEIEEIGSKYSPINMDALLEIGCGTGGFLIAAKSRFKNVVGIDIAFRWLVIARKRLEELNLEVPLVCCCAENLPFQENVFTVTVADNVLEHVRNPDTTLAEVHRVLRPAGLLFLGALNRFSITVEPHVRLWGVGFLPRRWMNQYVRFFKNLSYEHIKVLSLTELKKLLNRNQFQDHHILLPTITAEELKKFSRFERVQVSLYEFVKKTPVMRNILRAFGPFFHIFCYSHKNNKRPISALKT